MSRWRRAIEREPDRGPPLPLVPGSLSNGEYVPPPPTAHQRTLRAEALASAEDAARRAGLDRRRFLQSAGGVAAVLAAYNLGACGRGGSPSAGPTTTTPTSGAPGGTFDVPPAADVAACEEALSGSEFVFDVHTHHVVPDGPWRQSAPRIASMIRGLVPAGCTEDDPYRCLDRTAYLHDLFLASDTTVTLLSDVPNSGDVDAPLPWQAKRDTRSLAESLTAGGAPRVLLHDVIAPNFGDLSARLSGMEASVATGAVSAFKVYTAWGPGRRGFALDDPAIGVPVVEKAKELGVRVICAHKGLPLLEFDAANNGPRDLVAMASRYPDLQFVVYHGAYELQTREGPYDPSPSRRGVDSLVRALEEHGVAPNSNVWAELGTTWRELLDKPTEAAHAVGKLLKHVGSDRVMWGTDAIWYGSPQPQLMAFRAFQISEELQATFGYPALSDEVKRKVLGLNAAALFGVDPSADRCDIDGVDLGQARAEHRRLVIEGALPEPWTARGPVTRREALQWLGSLRAPWTP